MLSKMGSLNTRLNARCADLRKRTKEREYTLNSSVKVHQSHHPSLFKRQLAQWKKSQMDSSVDARFEFGKMCIYKPLCLWEIVLWTDETKLYGESHWPYGKNIIRILLGQGTIKDQDCLSVCKVKLSMIIAVFIFLPRVRAACQIA